MASPVSRTELLGVALHVLFTLLGCAISIGLFVGIGGLLSLPHPHPYDANSIFNPVFWVPSLLVGGIINRFVRHRWAFLAPAAIGAFVVVGIMFWEVSLFRNSAYELGLSHVHVWRYELERLFSPVSSFSPEKADRSLMQLFVTFPFLSSVAYSIGAWLGFKFGEGGPARTTPATNK
jgi:hypothetical protein